MSEIQALSCLSIKCNMYASLRTLISFLAQGTTDKTASGNETHNLGPQPKMLSGHHPTESGTHEFWWDSHLSGVRRQWWWCLTVERAELRNRGTWHEDAGKAQGGAWRLHLGLNIEELWLWSTTDRCAMKDETGVRLANSACSRVWARSLNT